MRWLPLLIRLLLAACGTDTLDRGDASAVIRIDPGFEADLNAGRTAKIQLLVDGTDSNTATSMPAHSRLSAAVSPPIPAPAIATFMTRQ